MKLTVIIPIYNEEKTCRHLIEKVKSVPIQKQIIVVNDGSTDGSSNILKKNHGIELITHEINLGKGSAVQSAIPHITGDFVVLQDGDLEYSPSDYEKMLTLLEADRADVVFGNRWVEENIFSELSHYRESAYHLACQPGGRGFPYRYGVLLQNDVN